MFFAVAHARVYLNKPSSVSMFVAKIASLCLLLAVTRRRRCWRGGRGWQVADAYRKLESHLKHLFHNVQVHIVTVHLNVCFQVV